MQGVEGWDVDLPTSLEANAIVHTVAKVCWMVVYILVYGIRPLIIRPKPVGMADVINWGLVLAFDGVLLYTLGFKSLLYLLLGTLFGGGLHPIAGHLIQEHYMFVTVSCSKLLRHQSCSTWSGQCMFGFTHAIEALGLLM